MTMITLWGDWGKATLRAGEILTEVGMPYRVYLTRDYDGMPVLSFPFGEIYGLDRIRDFVDRLKRISDEQSLFENLSG